MGKKRKADVDLDAERTLYTSFVSAANAVSQLYSQAAQQQRKIGAATVRQSLVRASVLWRSAMLDSPTPTAPDPARVTAPATATVFPQLYRH